MWHFTNLMALAPPEVHPMLLDAARGDPLAVCQAIDLAEEMGVAMNPFEVGKAYFIETLTLYYVGEVVESHPTYVKLRDASWVHRTGRKSVMMRHKSFDKRHFQEGELKPRTEYVGDWTVMLPVCGACEWPLGGLPKESIQ